MAKNRDLQLCKEVGFALESAIKAQGLSVSDAAKVLGVSRQAVYEYINGRSLPGIDVLYRACRAWKISVKYLECEFRATPYSVKPRRGRRQQACQLSLPYVLQALDNRDMQVTIVKKDVSSLQLQLTIQLAS